MKVNWSGVYPAITTQFRQDESLDLAATVKHLEKMIQSGIHGVVLLGTVGENTALEYNEKLEIIRAAAQHDYPVTDIDDMLAEIERGYGTGAHP